MELQEASYQVSSHAKTQPSQERRNYALEPSQWWDRLSMDQKLGVYQLNKFGYDLAFIRNTLQGPLAIVRRNGDYATVDHTGDVDLQPEIVVRD